MENSVLKKTDELSNSINNDEENKEFYVGEDVLQFFQSLNWNVVREEEDKSCKTRFFPDNDKSIESQCERLIQSQCYRFPEKGYDLTTIQSEEEEGELTGKYIPGVTNDPLYPRYSELNKKEQQELFYCHLQMKHKIFKESRFVVYQNLLSKAAQEFPHFQEFVRSMWIKHHHQRGFDIPLSVLEYIKMRWKMRTTKCLALYPPLYKSKFQVPLMLNDPNKDHSVMELRKKLRVMGRAQILKRPFLESRYDLLTDLNELCKIKPITQDPEEKPIFYQVPTASTDEYAEALIINENVDVVITCSGIKSIVDVYNIQKDWILPVTVKNVLGADNKKVVIIDKCLPPSAMSVYDKNVWHAKLLSKFALLLRANPNLIKSDTMKPSRSVQGPTLKQYEDVTETNKSCPPRQMCDQLESLNIQGIEEGQPVKNTQETLPSNKRKLSTNDSLESNQTSPVNETCQSRPKLIPQSQSRRHNLTYNLWNLHKSTHFNMSKQEQRSLNILVRSRIDGILHHQQDKQLLKEPVHVSSKLEYQPEYGASEMTSSELVREYVDTFIKATKLCRVRSVGHTKELMLCEVLTLAEIKETLQKAHKVETHKIFDPLYSVLTKLIDLPVGRYMLHHTPKMEAFAELLEESELNSTFNLTSHCEELNEQGVNLPAPQIDPFTLTSYHYRKKLPPALFTPSYESTRAGFLANSKFKGLPKAVKRKKSKMRKKLKKAEKKKKK